MEYRTCETEFSFHPGGKGPGKVISPFLKAGKFKEFVCSFSRILYIIQFCIKQQVFPGAEAFDKPVILKKYPDSLPGLVIRIERGSKDKGFPGIGPHQAEEDTKCRRLSCTVRAKEAKNFTL